MIERYEQLVRENKRLKAQLETFRQGHYQTQAAAARSAVAGEMMTLLGGEQLVRLSDYEALQAECEKLRAAMIEAKGHISHYMYGGSSYREPAAEAIALIDDALQEAADDN